MRFDERYGWKYEENGSDAACEMWNSANFDLIISQQSKGRENFQRSIYCWDACDVRMFPKILRYCFKEKVDLESQLKVFGRKFIDSVKGFDGKIEDSMYIGLTAFDYEHDISPRVEKHEAGLLLRQGEFCGVRGGAYVVFPNSQIGNIVYGMMITRDWPGMEGASIKQKTLLRAFLESPEKGIPNLAL